MGVLNYNYTCKDCGKSHASYFSDLSRCSYCGGKKLKKENIRDRNVDKFSEEGQKMYGNCREFLLEDI